MPCSTPCQRAWRTCPPAPLPPLPGQPSSWRQRSSRCWQSSRRSSSSSTGAGRPRCLARVSGYAGGHIPGLPCPACLLLPRALWLSAAAGLPCHWPPAQCTCFPLDCGTACVLPPLVLRLTSTGPCIPPPLPRAPARPADALAVLSQDFRRMSVEDAERSMGSVSVERRWVLRVLWVGKLWWVVGAEHAARGMGSVSVRQSAGGRCAQRGRVGCGGGAWCASEWVT